MKEILESLISEGLSTYQIGKKLSKSQTTIRYHLKKYNLKTIIKYENGDVYNIGENKKICSKCKIIKNLSEFYKKYKGKERLHNCCKNCSNDRVISKMISNKLKMISYKGNCCKNCGLKLENSHYCVFDFHHRDKLVKDKELKSMRSYSWENIIKELDKCDLLCSNCHRLEHARLRIEE